ncbi:Oligopeptide transport system permease protein OppB [Actinokineospora spheciospongiae]|uniref:Oligopeptide transport system permease protein OppB n=1 Tax=Actinokineospora spheciospongiae TaxID=909613 RepID=W7IFE7_9PSEU|nr:ABC transporter permease [Actinokineospora spheciospongiae]EWC59580.1 Oligopeptide transport system permease protein OppB [Actinokineospora spheciospongiae]
MTDALTTVEPPAAATPRGGGGGTLRYVLSKVGAALISLGLIVVLGFVLFRVLLPGDPVRTLTRGAPVTPEGAAALEREYGFDLPLWGQFTRYLGNLAHGDLDRSLVFKVPVAQKIGERLGPTLLLVGVGTLIAVVLGLWLGTRTAWRRGSRFDRTATGIALALWSAPTFWLGLVLLTATGGLFPSGGITYPDTPPDFLSQALDTAHHMVLPTITLVAVVYAQYQLVMRSSLVEEMHAEHLLTARAKGLRDDEVRRRHAVPNALLPTVTLVFLHLGLVVSGAITVETVFSWPGLGLLTFEALRFPDYPLLQGTFLVLAAAVVVMNLVADLLLRVLDPRVRAS